MRHRGMVATFGGVSASRTLLAALVAVVLGAYIYWVERPKIDDEAAARRLISFEVDDITGLTLRYPDKPDIELERRPDGWYMTEPLHARGDDDPIRLLLERIRDTAVERRIPAAQAESLETYGLQGDGERARISLVRADGSALPDIIVGATTPVDYQAFVRVEDRDEVLVTALIFHTGVGKSPYDLRSKMVFETDTERIDELWIGPENERVTLKRSVKGWRIVEPVSTSADPSSVRTLAASIREITALAFLDDADSLATDFGFDALSTVIEWQADGVREGFVLGGAAEGSPPGVYLRRKTDGLVVKAPEWLRARFDVDLNALRDKRLFSCPASEIVDAVFSRSDGTKLQLQRTPDRGWALDGVRAPLRQRVAERAIEQLAELSGKQVVATNDAEPRANAAQFGLDRPDVTVTLRAAGETQCGTAFARRAQDESGYYVRSASSGLVMTIPDYLYSRMDLRSEDLIDSSASP